MASLEHASAVRQAERAEKADAFLDGLEEKYATTKQKKGGKKAAGAKKGAAAAASAANGSSTDNSGGVGLENLESSHSAPRRCLSKRITKEKAMKTIGLVYLCRSQKMSVGGECSTQNGNDSPRTEQRAVVTEETPPGVFSLLDQSLEEGLKDISDEITSPEMGNESSCGLSRKVLGRIPSSDTNIVDDLEARLPGDLSAGTDASAVIDRSDNEDSLGSFQQNSDVEIVSSAGNVNNDGQENVAESSAKSQAAFPRKRRLKSCLKRTKRQKMASKELERDVVSSSSSRLSQRMSGGGSASHRRSSSKSAGGESSAQNGKDPPSTEQLVIVTEETPPGVFSLLDQSLEEGLKVPSPSRLKDLRPVTPPKLSKPASNKLGKDAELSTPLRLPRSMWGAGEAALKRYLSSSAGSESSAQNSKDPLPLSAEQRAIVTGKYPTDDFYLKTQALAKALKEKCPDSESSDAALAALEARWEEHFAADTTEAPAIDRLDNEDSLDSLKPKASMDAVLGNIKPSCDTALSAIGNVSYVSSTSTFAGGASNATGQGNSAHTYGLRQPSFDFCEEPPENFLEEESMVQDEAMEESNKAAGDAVGSGRGELRNNNIAAIGDISNIHIQWSGGDLVATGTNFGADSAARSSPPASHDYFQDFLQAFGPVGDGVRSLMPAGDALNAELTSGMSYQTALGQYTRAVEDAATDLPCAICGEHVLSLRAWFVHHFEPRHRALTKLIGHFRSKCIENQDGQAKSYLQASLTDVQVLPKLFELKGEAGRNRAFCGVCCMDVTSNISEHVQSRDHNVACLNLLHPEQLAEAKLQSFKTPGQLSISEYTMIIEGFLAKTLPEVGGSALEMVVLKSSGELLRWIQHYAKALQAMKLHAEGITEEMSRPSSLDASLPPNDYEFYKDGICLICHGKCDGNNTDDLAKHAATMEHQKKVSGRDFLENTAHHSVIEGLVSVMQQSVEEKSKTVPLIVIGDQLRSQSPERRSESHESDRRPEARPTRSRSLSPPRRVVERSPSRFSRRSLAPSSRSHRGESRRSSRERDVRSAKEGRSGGRTDRPSDSRYRSERKSPSRRSKNAPEPRREIDHWHRESETRNRHLREPQPPGVMERPRDDAALMNSLLMEKLESVRRQGQSSSAELEALPASTGGGAHFCNAPANIQSEIVMLMNAPQSSSHDGYPSGGSVEGSGESDSESQQAFEADPGVRGKHKRRGMSVERKAKQRAYKQQVKNRKRAREMSNLQRRELKSPQPEVVGGDGRWGFGSNRSTGGGSSLATALPPQFADYSGGMGQPPSGAVDKQGKVLEHLQKRRLALSLPGMPNLSALPPSVSALGPYGQLGRVSGLHSTAMPPPNINEAMLRRIGGATSLQQHSFAATLAGLRQPSNHYFGIVPLHRPSPPGGSGRLTPPFEARSACGYWNVGSNLNT